MSLPFKGPDQTLMALLGFVVDAGRRFATITDMKVGDGNQQAAVGTTIAMLEQGSRVMSAVHKRLHYAMRLEFKLLSNVMAEFYQTVILIRLLVRQSVKSEALTRE